MDVLFTKRAQKELEALERDARKAIARKIAALVVSVSIKDAQTTLDIKKLHGEENCYRLRVRDWRIIFICQSATVMITKVGLKKDMYRE